MKNKIFLLIVGIFLVSLVSAEVQTLGTFKKDSRITLVQGCINSTYSNISQILLPNSDVDAINKSMTKSGNFYNYTFTNSYYIGKYLVYGFCDENGSYTQWGYDFYVSPSGFPNTLGFYFVFILVIVAIFVFGYYTQNNYIMTLGSILILIFGFFIIKFGIDGIKDTQTTWVIGLVVWAVGIIAIFKSAEEQLKVYN